MMFYPNFKDSSASFYDFKRKRYQSNFLTIVNYRESRSDTGKEKNESIG